MKEELISSIILESGVYKKFTFPRKKIKPAFSAGFTFFDLSL